jgi:hypothetical protein
MRARHPQRAPGALAPVLAAAPKGCHCEKRDSAMKQSPSGIAPILREIASLRPQ